MLPVDGGRWAGGDVNPARGCHCQLCGTNASSGYTNTPAIPAFDFGQVGAAAKGLYRGPQTRENFSCIP